jgi:hypothetical protein
MKKKLTVTYKWYEDKDCDDDLFLVVHRLHTGYFTDFSHAVVDHFNEKMKKENETEFYARVYRCHDYPSDECGFDELQTAKDFCEYKMFGGEMPKSLKILEVEGKLDEVGD